MKNRNTLGTPDTKDTENDSDHTPCRKPAFRAGPKLCPLAHIWGTCNHNRCRAFADQKATEAANYFVSQLEVEDHLEIELDEADLA